MDISNGFAGAVTEVSPSASRARLALRAVLATSILSSRNLEAARTRPLERGDVGEIQYKTRIGAWDGGFALGLDPARGDYARFTNFADPDGNRWVLQERVYRNV